MYGKYMKLHVVAFGLAWGILTAIFVFIFGVFAMGGYGASYVQLMGSVYYGYSASFMGALIGAIWGFVYGFIMGAIFSSLYNCIACGCGKCGKCEKGEKCEKCGSCECKCGSYKTDSMDKPQDPTKLL